MTFKPLNWEIISHPMNWATIILMLIIAGTFGHLVLSLFKIEPSTQEGSAYNNLPAGQYPGQAVSGAITPQSAGFMNQPSPYNASYVQH